MRFRADPLIGCLTAGACTELNGMVSQGSVVKPRRSHMKPLPDPRMREKPERRREPRETMTFGAQISAHKNSARVS